MMTTTPKRFSCLRPGRGLLASALALSLATLELSSAAPAFADDAKTDQPATQPAAAPEGSKPPVKAAEPKKVGAEKGRTVDPQAAQSDGGPGKGRALGKDQRGPMAREDGSPPRGLPRLADRGMNAQKPLNREAALESYKRALVALEEAESAPQAAGEQGEADQEAARKEALRAARRARNDLRAAHRERSMEFLEKNEERIQELRSQLKARAEKARADRKERAEKQAETLKKEWGDKANHAPVRAELMRHAWRVARLERLIAIAEVSGRDDQAARAKELLEKEMASHPDRLKAAAAQPGKGPGTKNVRAVPGGGAATPATPATPAKPAVPAAPPAAPAAAKTEGGAQ